MEPDRIAGCLFGLAAGDALGAAVEFLHFHEIEARFGPGGIGNFAPWGEFPAGFYTDDTQMSLATAEGLLDAFESRAPGHVARQDAIRAVHGRYLRWLVTQNEPRERRAPGMTCLSALRSGRLGTMAEPLNDSKGCGGVMRTAPAGLVFPVGSCFEIGADCAAITHGHPSGYLPAGFLAELVAGLVAGLSFRLGIEQGLRCLRGYPGCEETLDKLDTAVDFADRKIAVRSAIRRLGEGWVGEEALAIALFCALRFEGDFRGGVVAAVNHDGDSDSTGSIAGAILGASLGLDGIPAAWVDGIENAVMIRRIATDIAGLRDRISGAPRP